MEHGEVGDLLETNVGSFEGPSCSLAVVRHRDCVERQALVFKRGTFHLGQKRVVSLLCLRRGSSFTTSSHSWRLCNDLHKSQESNL
mmetsp:Transcript_6267/g.11151  ORF Transcript_6267/g.11151 Transcript_6267/m.11151 type:complete len:86 (+) Transcript_6267:727-984(+)